MNAFSKALALGANLIRIVTRNPRRLSHVLGTALAASREVADPAVDLHRFPAITPEDLLPKPGHDVRVQFAFVPKTNASVSILEFNCMALLLHLVQARRVFEFGTYKGVSSTQLVLNLPAGGTLFTLDLPDDPGATAFGITSPKDAVIAAEPGKGSLVPVDVRHRITFLRQDSARFDESPHVGQMDLVFVDGAHNLEYVQNDSRKGWRMLRSGGVMVWHDCVPTDPDVVRFLLSCDFEPKRILGTSLAFAEKP